MMTLSDKQCDAIIAIFERQRWLSDLQPGTAPYIEHLRAAIRAALAEAS